MGAQSFIKINETTQKKNYLQMQIEVFREHIPKCITEANIMMCKQKAYILKAKIMDLKIGLNCKSISVSRSPEVR